MSQFVGDYIGLVHVLTSFVAMVAGAIVICTEKGTSAHRKVGYVFVVNMLALLISAMFIYRLFKGFGIFHIIALVGFVYILAGTIPAVIKMRGWIKWHSYFMYWSVIGLYCAFTAEIFVRVPDAPFWGAVGMATGLVAFLGGIYYGKYKKDWQIFVEKHDGEDH